MNSNVKTLSSFPSASSALMSESKRFSRPDFLVIAHSGSVELATRGQLVEKSVSFKDIGNGSPHLLGRHGIGDTFAKRVFLNVFLSSLTESKSLMRVFHVWKLESLSFSTLSPPASDSMMIIDSCCSVWLSVLLMSCRSVWPSSPL
eukprot:IDg11417t1